MTEPPAAIARPVLVLHAPADEAFVRGFLLPALGPSAHGEPVIDARDVTAVAIAELEQALHASGVTIAVITPAFLGNPWSALSEQLATRAAVGGESSVVPLLLEDCVLPLHIDSAVSLDFRSRADWDSEVQRLRDYLARPVPIEAPLPCPYPGMRPFQAEDARYFHGRDAEIDEVVALVTAGERELFIIGASGSGKSSLIAAGVVPRLAAQPGAAELVVRTMRPGDAPLGRLAECLEAAPGTPPDAAAIAAWAARHPGARLVVFVDQLEELFTLASRADQDGFAVALRALHAEPRCVVLLALRADFYAELLQSQLWLDGHRHVDLPPLRGAALRAAIELPARALDVYLEPGLIERLLADAAGEPGVLPLLQETLVQLWSRRRHHLLTLLAYEALGEGGRSGLAVAISSRADRCLREMTPAQAVIARRLLLRLVSFGEGRPNTRRRQTRAQLAAGEAPAELDGVLRQLVAARLVTMDGDDRSGNAQVDLCHEVLITAWPPFAAWVEARRADEQRRRQIQSSADEWIARGRGASGLLDDGELAAALAWRRTDAARELGESAGVTALIDASRDAIVRARWRWRRRIAAVVGGLIAFATVTATLAVIARRQADVAETQRAKAEIERRNAVRMLGEQYREVGRQAVIEGHLQRAIPYLVAAREQGIDDAGLRMLFRTATTSSVVLSLHHAEIATAVGFSDDGTRLVTAGTDKIARVWDAASGAPLTPPLVHPRMVIDAAIRGDGAQILTVSDDNTARIWDVTATPPPPIELHHADRINAASFSADGTIVVTASDDKTARIWNARTGQELIPPLQHDARVLRAVINRDASRVATVVSEGKTDAIWDARTGARIAPLEQDFWTTDDVAGTRAHLSLVATAAFSPDGTRLVTAATDNKALIWDAATGKTVAPPLQHDTWVGVATFSPDGAQIATLGYDGRVRFWNATSGAASGALDHPSHVLRILYSHDGARLLAACDDKVIRIWDVASRGLVSSLELESGALDVAISPDGARVATASADGFARVWDVHATAPRVIDARPRVDGARADRAARIFDAVYSPDGTRIATTDDDGILRLWTASGAPLARLKLPFGAGAPVFDRDGRRLATLALDGTVRFVEGDPATLVGVRREQGRDPSGDGGLDEIVGHVPAIGSFSPDGRRFATTAGERSARIWDTESRLPVTPPLVHDAAVVMARWSPDGRRMVTASKDGTARIWNADSGAPIGAPLAHPPGSSLLGALFSPDGARIATVCNDNNLRLWDAATGRLGAVLTGHAGPIIAAVFSPDGTLLLTNSDDRSARLWDVATARLAVPPLEHASRVESAAFSPDGGRIVTTSDKLAQVWDVKTGRPLTPPFVHPDYVRTALFSPDGNSVLTVALDAIRIWDAGLDTRSLDAWRRVARDGSFPQLGEALDRLAPASRVGR